MCCELTHEELAAYAAGEAEGGREVWIEGHLAACEACRRRLASLRRADAALRALPPCRPPARAVLETRRALSRQIRAQAGPEIMTLEEAAEMLRIGPAELEEIADELPAFELAGRVRIRRARLVEWIENREQAFAKSNIQSQAARLLAAAYEKGAAL